MEKVKSKVDKTQLEQSIKDKNKAIASNAIIQK